MNIKKGEEGRPTKPKSGSSKMCYKQNMYPYEDEFGPSYSDSELAAEVAIATTEYESNESEIRKLLQDVDKVQEEAAFNSKVLAVLSAVDCLTWPPA